jgi:hypothetical protein
MKHHLLLKCQIYSQSELGKFHCLLFLAMVLFFCTYIIEEIINIKNGVSTK